jgi:phosphoribosylformylglycinamidine synthase
MSSTDLKIGIVTFPGTLDDKDACRAVKIAGAEPISLWFNDHNLKNVDGVIIPGGFSYGDYLRCGAIARFSSIMENLVDAAKGGLPILGICNGFQILTESHLLEGALAKNDHQKFICQDQKLQVNSNQTAWSNLFEKNQEIIIPLKNGEGRFTASQKVIDALEAEGRVVFRYLDQNPNGSINNIAGITNKTGNVVGLMPHPEHAVENGFGTGINKDGIDGLNFFKSAIEWIKEAN